MLCLTLNVEAVVICANFQNDWGTVENGIDEQVSQVT